MNYQHGYLELRIPSYMLWGQQNHSREEVVQKPEKIHHKILIIVRSSGERNADSILTNLKTNTNNCYEIILCLSKTFNIPQTVA